MLLRRRKLLWRCAGARRTQPPVDCLWCLEPSFPGLCVNSDNLPFSFVILFLYSLICHYMHETWASHAYGFALGFLRKIECDTHSLGGGGGHHRGRRTGTWPRGLLLAEPPLELRAIPAMETRLRWRRGRWKPEKGIEGGRRGRGFFKTVRMHKWYDD
jgi:hypothetical protein